jgi:hypothetical protein
MTKDNFRTMEFEDWAERYNPDVNHLDPDASFQDENGIGIMFETFGSELEYVLKIANTEPNRVWTYMDGDEGTFIGNGYHLVNRIGYFITEKPCDFEFMEVPIDSYDEYEDEEDDE